jgi:hypothetical protein
MVRKSSPSVATLAVNGEFSKTMPAGMPLNVTLIK